MTRPSEGPYHLSEASSRAIADCIGRLERRAHVRAIAIITLNEGELGVIPHPTAAHDVLRALETIDFGSVRRAWEEWHA